MTTSSFAVERERDAALDLFLAARSLMRYKETHQWQNLENAVNRYDAARQCRINNEIAQQAVAP